MFPASVSDPVREIFGVWVPYIDRGRRRLRHDAVAPLRRAHSPTDHARKRAVRRPAQSSWESGNERRAQRERFDGRGRGSE